MTVHPTRTCFDDAMDFMELHYKTLAQLCDERYIIVHAICLMPDGRPYAHAWVEDNKKGECIFGGIINGQKVYLFAEKADYYECQQVQDTTKYTIKQAMMENLLSYSYGPWEQKYLSLTSNFQNG